MYRYVENDENMSAIIETTQCLAKLVDIWLHAWKNINQKSNDFDNCKCELTMDDVKIISISTKSVYYLHDSGGFTNKSN